MPTGDAAPPRPALVIDLDSTILLRSAAESLRLYLLPSLGTGRILPGAREALTRLAGRVAVVAVTARWVRCRRNTRRWLEAHGLGFIAAHHSPLPRFHEAGRARFKAGLLSRLQAAGLDARIGVGDRGSDLEAYLERGLFPALVAPRPGSAKHRQLRRRIAARSLREGVDYVLFGQEPGALPLWDGLGEWLERRLAGPGLTPPAGA